MRGRTRGASVAGGAVVAMVALSCATTRGADSDSNGHAGGNPCARGLYVVDGACVSPREIDAYCGARSSGALCVVPACAAGDAVNLRTGACVPQLAARAIVARDRPSPVAEGASVGCRDDHVLVANGEHAACLARADACPRTARWDAARASCVSESPCAVGEVRSRDACVRIVANGVIDVGRWSRAVLGADGGAGDERFCRVLSQRPWDFDVGVGSARTVTFAVNLRFPNNDVTQATATATPTPTPTPNATPTPTPNATPTPTPTAPPALSSPALLATESALDTLLIPLRALSRTAATTDAAATTVHLSCTLRGGSSPHVLAP